MPTELKNSTMKMALRPDTPARTCMANGDSARSMPARNAPSAGDTPTACAAHVAPTPVSTASSTDSSWLRFSSGRRSRRGVTR